MVGHDAIIQPQSRSDAAGFVSTERWLRDWQRAWSQIACGAGLAIGCFLLWRRFDGEFQHPLGWQALIAVGFSLVVTVATIRYFWTDDGGRSLLSGRYWLPAIMLLSVGLAVSLVGTNGLALFAFWAWLLTTECIWFFRCASEGDGSLPDVVEVGADEVGEDEVSDVRAGSTVAAPLAAGVITAHAGGETIESESREREEGEVLQRLFRNRDANGQEVLLGELRAEFAIGERQTRLHVAFCPPLEQPPQVYAEATFVDEGLGQATVKVAQVLVLGTRIDVELEAPAETAGFVQVEFYAAVES